MWGSLYPKVPKRTSEKCYEPNGPSKLKNKCYEPHGPNNLRVNTPYQTDDLDRSRVCADPTFTLDRHSVAETEIPRMHLVTSLTIRILTWKFLRPLPVSTSVAKMIGSGPTRNSCMTEGQRRFRFDRPFLLCLIPRPYTNLQQVTRIIRVGRN